MRAQIIARAARRPPNPPPTMTTRGLLRSLFVVFGSPLLAGWKAVRVLLSDRLESTFYNRLIERSPDVVTAARRLANYCAAVPALVATELAVRPVSAIVASTSSVIDLSRRSAAVRAAAERLLTTPPMSRFSTLIVSDAA